MPKGQKKTKGTPELYNEVKKQVSLSLTPTAVSRLDRLAKRYKLSRSEFVEQIARGFIPLSKPKNERNNMSREFVLYPTQSLLLLERDKLPEEMGSFLVSDLSDFAYFDSCPNLKLRFQNDIFLERLEKQMCSSYGLSNYFIFWIKYDDISNAERAENELISQFRTLKPYKNFTKSFDPQIKKIIFGEN